MTEHKRAGVDTDADINKQNDSDANADTKTNAFTGIASGTKHVSTSEDTTTTITSLSSSTRTPNPNADTLKSQLWYKPTLTQIHPVTRRLLEKRIGTTASTRDQIKSHIEAVRDEAWQVFPYPVIGSFHFAEPTYSEHPLYRTGILEPLKQKVTGGGADDDDVRLLDVGCGFASDFRMLQASGVDLKDSKVVGLDREMGFVDLSYELFGDDTETLGARFVTADILKPKSIPDELWGKFDIIWGGASFHLFNWKDQVEAYVTAVRILKKGPREVRLLGYSAAHRPAGERFGMFWHDPESFVKLWEEVVGRLGKGWSRRREVEGQELDGWHGDRGFEEEYGGGGWVV